MTAFTYKGRQFDFEVEPDMYADPPWEHGDCTGVVIDSRSSPRSKLPHERILSHEPWDRRRGRVFYDVKATMARALEQGWRPRNVPNGMCGKRALAALAVEEDFQRMRRWLNDDWYYVTVVVKLLCRHGGVVHEETLGGIESDDTAYLELVKFELADNCLHEVDDECLAC